VILKGKRSKCLTNTNISSRHPIAEETFFISDGTPSMKCDCIESLMVAPNQSSLNIHISITELEALQTNRQLRTSVFITYMTINRPIDCTDATMKYQILHAFIWTSNFLERRRTLSSASNDDCSCSRSVIRCSDMLESRDCVVSLVDKNWYWY
jgi:hypothetical protein